jgi:thiamine biosynthesis protein ThiI
MLPKEAKSFRVDTKRQDKNFRLNSMEINAKVGEMILEKLPSYKVDLHKPQIKINIEIKYKKAIFYFEKIKGFGGFPIGIAGKVLMLISGGIDSPIAAKLLLKKGFIVDFITFITPPHTSPIALEKVEKLIKIISLNNSLYEPSLHVCNFTNLQNELSHMSDKTYQITIMRRYFFKIARDLALKEKCHAIATGESIGQVASQTIESMTTIQNAIGDFIVLRPLVTYDKNEIIDLAIKYKTYETSILPYADCCALFVPKNPVTKPSVLKAEKIEKNLELAEQVYQNILSKIVKKKCE